ncbi:MAG: DUF5765 domain-containing protein [Paracoccaceae bacterium]
MCWSTTASIVMVGVGAAATLVTARRGDPAAVWGTIGYFTLMEGLQAAGYGVVDQCGSPANRALTQLSYLHIALQPIMINAFCMAIAPNPVSARMRRWVYALAAVASVLLMLRLVPLDWAGECRPGDVMCGAAWCLISGDWHIGWEVPLNNLWSALDIFSIQLQFPPYLASVFLLPLAYGCWRFVVFHAMAGPMLATMLTSNPNEMPAIWCMFSVGVLLIGLSPAIRTRVFGAHRRALA